MKDDLPDSFLELLNSVTAKRARVVIDHILKFGQITTEDLQNTYGYQHPPRAIRDVREQGIPLVSNRIKSSDGKTISAYKFGNPNDVRNTKLSGRTAFTNALKNALIEQYGSKCNISLLEMSSRDLQIDHRIPFEIAGDKDNQEVDDYMLLSASSNRLKSWTCEHCPNWVVKDIAICRECYWAYPENYKHVAMKQVRRVDIEWAGEETLQFDRLSEKAKLSQTAISIFIKKIIEDKLNKT